MKDELADLLVGYMNGWRTLSDCADWLAGVSWDDPDLTPDLRAVVGSLELLATEVIEGLRPEREFKVEASAIVGSITGQVDWLLATEVLENLRPEREFLQEASAIVGSITGQVYWTNLRNDPLGPPSSSSPPPAGSGDRPVEVLMPSC